MAEKSFPFASVNGDRVYGAADWADYFKKILTNGVFPVGSQLLVSAGGGMSVSISAGNAWLNGYGYANTDAFALDIDAADGVLKRKDRIVLRWGRVARAINLAVIKGTASASPVAPTLVRDADYYDIGLAEISIPNGITAIEGAHISDTRLDPAVCGIVSSLITPDTEGWYEGWEAEYLAWLAGKKDEYEDWFNELEAMLDGEVATQLAAAILTKADKATNYTATLNKNDWSDGIQTVNVTGITAGMEPFVELTLSATAATAKAELEAWGLIGKIVTGAGNITVTCYDDVPEIDLNIRLKVVY